MCCYRFSNNYSWPLYNMGLNCTGLQTGKFFFNKYGCSFISWSFASAASTNNISKAVLLNSQLWFPNQFPSFGSKILFTVHSWLNPQLVESVNAKGWLWSPKLNLDFLLRGVRATNPLRCSRVNCILISGEYSYLSSLRFLFL